MKNLVNKIQKHFDKKEETRERLLDISHDAIRNSSRAMAALHRKEEDKVSNLLDEIEENIEKLNEILASEPQFKGHGSLVAAHREYAEIILTKSQYKKRRSSKSGRDKCPL